jgi:hypothetical protein
MKNISLILVLVILAIGPVSFGAEFQGHKWGADLESTMKALFDLYRHKFDSLRDKKYWTQEDLARVREGMTQPKVDTTSPWAKRDSWFGRFYVDYFDEVYCRTAQVTFFFDSKLLSRVLIRWEGW